MEALINAEKVKKNLDTIGFEASTSNIDLTTTSIVDETKSVRFPSNLSEFMNLIDDNDHFNTSSHDRSVSVTGNDLKSWLQIVRNEATTVLQLISNQKNDANYDKRSNRDESVQTVSLETNYRDKNVQTILLGEEIEKNEEKMAVLQLVSI